MKLRFIVFLISQSVIQGQEYEYASRGADPELSEIPDHIVQCYTDSVLYDRYRRLPANIESLVALLRKVELNPSVRQWPPGKLAANLIHKFRFDGILYDRCVDTSTGASPIVLDLQSEVPKMQLVWQLIDGDREEVPDDILEPDEKCALHWMLSYNVNTTMREEEYLYLQSIWQNQDFGYQNDAPLQPDHFSVKNKGAKKKDIVYNPPRPFYYNCDERIPHSLNPLETGVIWTRAGPVTSGTMFSGLAAGLRPQSEYWPSFGNSQNSRRIDNTYGVTISADVGQTAILKKRGQKYTGPDGYFNNTLCPSEFMLTSEPSHYGEATFTHLTIAEINGGLDGLILGLAAKDWDRRSQLSLSQMIDSYYGRQGLSTNAESIKWTACQRYDNFKRKLDHHRIQEDALTFALELKHHLIATVSEASIRNAVAFAFESLKEEIGKLEVALSRSFFECKDDFASTSAAGANNIQIEDEKIRLKYSGIADVSMIMDTSIFAAEDDTYQQQLAAALALQLDIWSMGKNDDKNFADSKIINGGDTIEFCEGHDGRPIYIDESMSTNKAKTACHVAKTRLVPTGGDIDPGVALTNVLSRQGQRRYEQILQGQTLGRSQVVVLVTFGRIGTSDKSLLHNAVYRMKTRTPEAKLLIVTRWAPVDDFYKFVDDPSQDIITLQPLNEERRAILDARRIADRIAKIPGHVTFGLCSGPDYHEWQSQQVLYISPSTQRTLILHPRQFWASEDLEMIFDVRYNSANICWSRRDYDKGQPLQDEQCTSVSVTKGSSVSRKATFSWIDPCDGKPPDFCLPIYFRIEAVDSGGLNCLTHEDDYPCRVANAIQVTIRHRGMSCSASGLSFPSIVALLSILALINQYFS